LEFDSSGARRIISIPSSAYLGQKIQMLHNWVIEMVKIQWNCYGPEDATWELEDSM